ncbi:PREDICTED: uncharacterized protein LOC109588802 isoform X1 [Amphimedon queenslandica]|uniref:MD-2-related lipid-recognition domain-containing protein n=2 Tax=Amphimedon queenslandica TaxID=400682 RepID=A0AAN0JUB1_AMPQE|nr:PREDICTED: uncharacterized protein LOC109588802 isoform X1 [Amphimedon queenslandica]|eukprot:XP_019860475.1 PREDICTED: uncharacterized protein LOC109588802 isoform X1 [Amphimedon queenslandica]
MNARWMILSVVLAVSTLTGSTNNYYNESADKGYMDCCKFSNTLHYFDVFSLAHNMQATSHDFGEITNVTSNTFGKTVKPGQNYIIRGIIKLKKELKWGTLHQTMTHQFKNIINLAIEDAKYNLCDIISSLTATGESGVYCPLKPGIYHGLYNSTIPSPLILWPGKYCLKVIAYDESSNEIFCGMTVFNIEK